MAITLNLNTYYLNLSNLIAMIKFNDRLDPTGSIYTDVIQMFDKGRVKYGDKIISRYALNLLESKETNPKESTLLTYDDKDRIKYGEDSKDFGKPRHFRLNTNEYDLTLAVDNDSLYSTIYNYEIQQINNSYVYEKASKLITAINNIVVSQATQTLTINLIDTSNTTIANDPIKLYYANKINSQNLRLAVKNLIDSLTLKTKKYTNNTEREVINKLSNLRMVVNKKFVNEDEINYAPNVYNLTTQFNISKLEMQSDLWTNDKQIGVIMDVERLECYSHLDLTLEFLDASNRTYSLFYHYNDLICDWQNETAVKLIANYVAPAVANKLVNEAISANTATK